MLEPEGPVPEANHWAEVRASNIKTGEEKSTRIELRMPDPACNLYLGLGEHVFEQFLRNKRIIWGEARAHVSRAEVEYYLPIL